MRKLGKMALWDPSNSDVLCFCASDLILLTWGFKLSWQICLCSLGTKYMCLKTQGIPIVWLSHAIENFLNGCGEMMKQITFPLTSIIKLVSQNTESKIFCKGRVGASICSLWSTGVCGRWVLFVLYSTDGRPLSWGSLRNLHRSLCFSQPRISTWTFDTGSTS